MAHFGVGGVLILGCGGDSDRLSSLLLLLGAVHTLRALLQLLLKFMGAALLVLLKVSSSSASVGSSAHVVIGDDVRMKGGFVGDRAVAALVLALKGGDDRSMVSSLSLLSL